MGAGAQGPTLMSVPSDGHGGAGELLPHARLHDLRHVHATILLLAGVPGMSWRLA
jgi:integrase